MGRTKTITIQMRAKDYKSHSFYVSDTNILMCGFCNMRLEWEKKDTLDKHLKSAVHKKNEALPAEIRGTKRQATMQGMLQQQKKAKVEKKEFVQETVKMFLQANIPLHKIDHPAVRAYMEKYIPGSGDLPKAATLRNDFVPFVGDMIREEIKKMVQDKKIVIIADETTDSRGRCVFAILFHTMSATAKQEVYLASCSFLDRANGTTCSQSIIDTLKQFEVEYSNVLGLASDSARYMGTCFRALQTLIGEHMLHFQCWAHKVNLVGDVFLKQLPELSSLVTKLKMAFLHSRKMKNAYINFICENYPTLSAKLFPMPIITRWNSWFTSVQYLDIYLETLVSFLRESRDEFSNSSTEAVLVMFEDEHLRLKLTLQVKFVSEVCVKIKKLINDLEGSDYALAHILWDELLTLKATLQKLSTGDLPKGTVDILDQCGNENQRNKLEKQLLECIKKCLAKLENHMEPGKTNDFYQELGKLFNPVLAGQTQKIDKKSLEISKKKIPLFSNMVYEDFEEGYEYFHRQLIAGLNKEEVAIDCVQLLLAIKITHANFANAAIRSIWAPTNSVDAERFFSKYNLVVSDRRTRMTEKTVETCSMLTFNSEL